MRTCIKEEEDEYIQGSNEAPELIRIFDTCEDFYFDESIYKLIKE